MRGTELTEAQIESAREFANNRRAPSGTMPDDSQQVALTFGELARLVAWYGALRFKAGRDGTGGTFEAPGPIEMCERK